MSASSELSDVSMERSPSEDEDQVSDLSDDDFESDSLVTEKPTAKSAATKSSVGASRPRAAAKVARRHLQESDSGSSTPVSDVAPRRAARKKKNYRVDDDDEDDEDEDDDDGDGDDDEDEIEDEVDMIEDEEDDDVLEEQEIEPEAEPEDEEMDEDDKEIRDIELESRGGTPDVTRMTARQRAKESGQGEDLMSLPADLNNKRKQVLTEEEMQLKRAELARRRKNLSDRRLEEEKQETIDKLLKRRATKGRTKADAVDEDGVPQVETPEQRSRLIAHHPAFFRYINNKQGSTLSIPTGST